MELDFNLCGHEAAHAVMRYLVGLRATKIIVTEQGGICEGDGGRCNPQASLFVTLAGYAYETGCGLYKPDFRATKKFKGADGIESDFALARRELSERPSLRAVHRRSSPHLEGVERSLKRYFARTCEMLWPVADVVEDLAIELQVVGEMGARRVSSFLSANIPKERRFSELIEANKNARRGWPPGVPIRFSK